MPSVHRKGSHGGSGMARVSGGAGARLRAYVGGADVATLQVGRDAAALELVGGYERALSQLHCDDVAAIAWYRARLVDARTIAGLPSAVPVQSVLERRHVQPRWA